MSGQPSILIVEDDEQLRRYLAEALAAEGYMIHTAAHGIEALTWLKTNKPTVVLTDLVMPEQDGVSLIRAIRRQLPDQRIVAMSGRGRTDISMDSLQLVQLLGADQTLEKPFTLGELTAALAQVLPRH